MLGVAKMPSLYKRGRASLHAKLVPVSAVSVPLDTTDGELSAHIEELVAQEIDCRWRDACARLEASEREQIRALATEAQRVVASAREEGYARGLSEARAWLQAEMTVVRQAYTQLESDRLGFIEENKRDIAALALRMAEVMLRSELQTNASALITLFQSAYEELVAKRKVFVFVHPEKLSQVEALKHFLPLPTDGPVHIRADSTLDRDSFRLEDELGGVCYDLPEGLNQLKVETSDETL